MLEAAIKGATFETLREHKAYGHAKKYVSLLVSTGLIEQDKKRKTYRTTARGKKLLAKYKEIDLWQMY